jgi:hypothetical protein
MTELLSRLDYRVVGSPDSFATPRTLAAVLDGPAQDRGIVKKAAYESNGWTYLFDPEMVVMMHDTELANFATENATDIFAWVCEGVSASYGFRVFKPALSRDLLVVDGSVETDVGTRMPEEHGLDWSQADDADILALASRLGAPFDYLETDRSYVVYTLDESHMHVPVEERSSVPADLSGNLETPRRGVLLFAAPVAVLIAVFMFVFFSADEWTLARAIGQAGFTAIALGLVVATVAPSKGGWGIRVVTFTIFAAYLAYLIHQFWFSGQEVTLSSRMSQPSPFNSILGFLFFGIPCLLYTLWESTWGRLGHMNAGRATRSDKVVFAVAWIAQALFLCLSALVVITGVWRSLSVD